MQSSPVRSYDEAALDYFEEHILSRADVMFRFGVALTGSQDEAKDLVKKSFGRVVQEFTRIMHIREFNVTGYLLAECWRSFTAMERKPFKGTPDAVGRFLAGLPLDVRATVFAVDVAGLTPADAAKAFRTEEKDIRAKLATGRRALLAEGTDI